MAEQQPKQTGGVPGRPKDIPDMNAKKIPTVVLEPQVQQEREVRRYIRKDGTFIRDLHQIFAICTGEIREGKLQYRQTKTPEEAEKIVTEICEKSGRKVERDSITKRLKATPGWRMEISVPGFLQSEQKAAVESDASLQARATNESILALKASVEEQGKIIEEQAKVIAELRGGDSAKPKDESKETTKKK